MRGRWVNLERQYSVGVVCLPRSTALHYLSVRKSTQGSDRNVRHAGTGQSAAPAKVHVRGAGASSIS